MQRLAVLYIATLAVMVPLGLLVANTLARQ
jgi:hypothetical protein